MKKLKPEDWKHGNATTYSYHGCRCALCKQANTDRSRETGASLKYSRSDNRIKRYARQRYRDLLSIQDRKCAICQKPFSEKRLLQQDHDHATRLIRGLLCRSCNTAIGLLQDSPEMLRTAINYLENPPSQKYIGDLTYSFKGFGLKAFLVQ